MELKSPTPKRKGHHPPTSSPFPIVSERNSFFNDFNGYETFSGFFNGSSVIVDDPEEIKALYTMGCFGKASLSRGYPSFDKQKRDEPLLLKEYQWERRKEWSDKLNNIIANIEVNKSTEENKISICDETTSNSMNNNDLFEEMDVTTDFKTKEDSCSSNKESTELTHEINLSISECRNYPSDTIKTNKTVLVINDCNGDDNLSNLNPHLEVEPLKTVMEVLYLSLEEAFFLSFALGCLHVMDLSGNPLSLPQLWRTFISSQPDFIENYAAYHYFRAKGWVVKSGLKFGVHYLLYKDGPSFYHASYGVLIESIKPVGDKIVCHPEGQLTWDKMSSLNRMAETCNKEIVVCKIQRPEIAEEELASPLILKKFKVKEYLLRRWQPCQEKEKK